MVSSSCTCIIRLPSPSNSTTVRSGRAAATPMANEMPLPIAPNSRMVRNFSCGREGICAKNHEQWPPEFTISQSCGKAFSSASTTSRGSSSPGSISNTWLSGFESRMRAAIASLRQLAVAGRQGRRQRLDAQARVGAQVMARHFLALADRDGVDVDLQHLRLRPELAAAARVVGERAADRDDEIGLLEVLEADLGREAARDADAEGIVVEQASRGKRRRQQSARLRGQRPAGGARSGFDRTQAGEHDDPFGAGKQLRGARPRRRDAAESAKGAAAVRARAWADPPVRPRAGPADRTERRSPRAGARGAPAGTRRVPQPACARACAGCDRRHPSR